ncbi:hypothetical protein IEQ44_07640 [Nocardioides sp. Y6]|uniref:Alpha-tubulin suppressor-like RCC1 family protein n=1 Tax=Nocardioides malaquae TaxID=2773426 RepID=A0ABR9RSG6_9ACTN|nr:hypothetical protein [Nocardioides malaquae]MBE7324521.1 hypothetical protein [Nocardioides malaquae]
MLESRRPAALLTTLLTAGALGLSGFGLSGLATASSAAPAPAGAAEVAVAEASPSARAAARKGLRVRVLKPKAMRKQVRVTVTGPRQNGKKFRKVIKATRWWPKVKPGVYRIKANTFRKYEQRVVPTVNVAKVRIPRSRKFREVKVTYANPRFCTGQGYSLKAWGDNTHGQLGTTSPAWTTSPTTNRWISGLTAITGARSSTYALCNDGSVWAWGLNSSYQLGVGHTKNRHYPVRVHEVSGVTALAAGTETAYALTADGRVWAWGSGRYGELGNRRSGFGTVATKPVPVSLPPTIVQIAAGGRSAYALTDEGEVYAWGAGGVGQRGNGTTGAETPRPVKVAGLDDIVEIDAGQVTAYALGEDGTMYGWGGSNQGEIPNVAPSTNTPAGIATGVTKIGASQSAGFFVTGTLHGFGSGRHHDSGRDTGGSPTTPDAVPGPDGLFSSVLDLVGKGHTSYLLDEEGYVYSWGDNNRGQVGLRPITGPGADEGLLPQEMNSGEYNAPARAIGAGQFNGYLLYSSSEIPR